MQMVKQSVGMTCLTKITHSFFHNSQRESKRSTESTISISSQYSWSCTMSVSKKNYKCCVLGCTNAH